ncbi:MAG: C40 family peptidase [Flavobacteriaceae bacterium]|nr:C40 family peptidase [Flavobacteriaceae bacterium]
MQYGICNLGIVAIRSFPSQESELGSQLLYGDHFKILEQRKYWSRIRVEFDGFEGWVSKDQYLEIDEKQFLEIKNCAKEDRLYSANLVDYIHERNNALLPVCIGSIVANARVCDHFFEGETKQCLLDDRKELINTALHYLNAPYLWGGKTPFGIDASGFTQMIYKMHGVNLQREVAQQSQQGEPLSFIEECEAGDLAFFDDKEGNIIHVGIIMENNYIIHAHGKVRIDRIDHTGIFNVDIKRYSHQLRVIKKIY